MSCDGYENRDSWGLWLWINNEKKYYDLYQRFLDMVEEIPTREYEGYIDLSKVEFTDSIRTDLEERRRFRETEGKQ